MIYTEADLTALGCRALSITYNSLAADSMTLEFISDLREAVELPFDVGAPLHLLRDGFCIFRGWVTDIETTEQDHTRSIGVTVQNVIALLDALPVDISSYDESGETLESAAALIRRALAAAAKSAELGDERFDINIESSVLAVYSSGTESVWSAITSAVRWVANAASWYDHTTGTLHIAGGTITQGTKATASVDMPTDVTAGTLTIGDTALDIATLSSASAWPSSPATVLTQRLRSHLSVAAVATGATSLALTAREPGISGNSIALAWTPAPDSADDAPEPAITPFSGGITGGTEHLASIERLRNADDLPGSIVSIQTQRTAWETPPVCALRGRYTYTKPAGSSIHTPGAFIYVVPESDVSVGGAQSAPAVQKDAGDWMLVKGYKVPAGWDTPEGEAVDMHSAVSNGPECHQFWSRYFRQLRRTNISCLSYGTPVFEPVPVDEAYPEEEEDDESNAVFTAFRPPTLETANGPANYQEFSPHNTQNLYALYEGQFPASSSARGNVSGLRFCRGQLRQFVWLKSEYTGTLTGSDITEFFSGSSKISVNGGEQQVSCTCLTLDGIFINRRRTRYQSGTLAQPSDSTDGTEAEADELSRTDYIQAITDYYISSRPYGTHGSMTLAAVANYSHSDRYGILKSAQWKPASGDLTLTTGAGGPLGVDAILQRQQVGRRQALSDIAASVAAASQANDSADGDGDGADDSYPMVGAAASATYQAITQAARAEPFAVYRGDDGKIWINGGPLPTPTGMIDVDPINITDYWQTGRQYYIKAAYNRTSGSWEPKVLYRDAGDNDTH